MPKKQASGAHDALPTVDRRCEVWCVCHCNQPTCGCHDGRGPNKRSPRAIATRP